MLHLHSAVRGTVPQKQRCDTADLNANWYEMESAVVNYRRNDNKKRNCYKSGTVAQTKATGQRTVLKLFH
jgi:hypothetical protein